MEIGDRLFSLDVRGIIFCHKTPVEITYSRGRRT